MDKETLSNYGWIVICVMVLAVMLAFASPFGNFIANAIKSTTQGLFDVNQGALDAAGIHVMEQEFEQMLNGTSKVECPIKYGEKYTVGIEEGAYYTYVFHEDGSLEMSLVLNGQELGSESAPAGTVGYDGTKLTGTDEETGETIIVGDVTLDGTKINLGDMVLLLGEPCYHKNTEIKNNNGAYSGDVYCKDCGMLLEQGTCSHDNTEIQNNSDSYSGDLVCKDCGEVLNSGSCYHNNKTPQSNGNYICNDCDATLYVVPEGGTYYTGVTSDITGNYTGATNTYHAGDILPIASKGDVYVQGDYEYRYMQYFNKSYSNWTNFYDSAWGARVLTDTKSSYGKIISSINGNPVTHLVGTFWNCTSMTISPEIPNGITDMSETFYGCTNLTNSPIIPNGVTDMGSTFGASGLIVAPTIPNTVRNMSSTFRYCKSLTTAPIIPSGVNDIYCMFDGCTKLKTYHGSTDAEGDFSNYLLPSGAKDLTQLFMGCFELTVAPKIPEGVERMQATFDNCTSLTVAPSIPSTVTDMTQAFSHCTSLVNAPDMSKATKVTNMQHTFSNTAIVNAPTIPNSVTNMNYTFSECKSLKNAPIIPSGVKTMDYTFMHCNSLDGAITINATPTTYKYCLYKTAITEILGSCSIKGELLATK